jgi:hypothetical protein
MGSRRRTTKIQHGEAPKYEGPSIDGSAFAREELRELARFISSRTVYGAGAADPSGGGLAWLIRNAGDKNSLINLGGYGMTGVEQAAYAALNPSVAAIVDGWIAWKRG